MKILTIFCALLLTACDPSGSESAGPHYVLQDGHYYGYELATGEVVMLAFLGYRDGVLQLLERNNQYTGQVYECSNPCTYMKVYNIGPSGILGTTRQRTSPDMAAFIAMQDAAAGYLTMLVRQTDAGPQYFWVSEGGLIAIPVQSADSQAKAMPASTVSLDPYTSESAPIAIAKYGARLKEVEHYRRRAAEMALASGKCDSVFMAELNLESELDSLTFWVDCQNGARIYLTEDEIDANATIMTQAEKSWSKADALAICKAEIKSRALIPSDVDIHEILGTSIYKSEVTSNVVVTMDFDAGNAFGVDIPYTAKCYFEPDKVGEIEIHARK